MVVRELPDLDREFALLVDGLFGPSRGHRQPETWRPSVEQQVKDGTLVVRCDLPGVDPKELNVSLDGTTLTITGERKDERREKDSGYRVSEVRYGRLERRLTVPEGLDPEKVTARYANGVLEVTLPLPAEEAPRRVPIEVDPPKKAA